MAKVYRFATSHAVIGFDIMADTNEEAVKKANQWIQEREALNCLETLILDNETLPGVAVTAGRVAVYIDNPVTEDEIEDIEEVEVSA